MPTLDWIGKKAVVNHHREVPFHLLKRNAELSVGDSTGGNIVVHGDNLIALKALLPYLSGQVNFIYIDPPYNTGNEDWIYNDNVNSPEIIDWLGKTVGKELEDLSRHDKWLCMMYPRLRLLKEFLKEDGFICVQIDDNEAANLKGIMDDIFLSINYVTSIYVQVRYLDKTLKRDMQFHKQIEQILIYQKSAKSKPNLKSKEYKLDKFCWYVTEKAPGKEITLGNKRVVIFQPGEYQIKEGECSETGLKEIWASGAILDGNSSGRFFRDYLTGRVDTDGLGVMYKVYDIGDDSFDYRYFTGPKKKNATRGKYYQGVPTSVLTAETEDQNSDIPIANFYDMAADFGNCRHEGGVEFKSGKKPEKLISMLMEHFSNKGDLVLDSFAGSATTAAVAHKMGRRWATIEMGDHCFSHTLPRLKNVVSGKDRTGISEQFNYEGVGGFSFCELDSPLFNSQGHINNIVTFNDLARHVYFTETGEPLPHDAKPDTPLLGIHNGTAVYLLYNGILKDKSPDGGNVLTRALLSLLPEHDGPKVIYGTACKIGPEQRRREGIVFKQLPYKLRTGVL